mmetsp:Transcript_31757/g.48712  ORF Transcript_31757/g.48712 Transcript_31757/m.48712 type:complete len:98 (-) Transcript_31757:332-625(-)|eukprot:CAMPEP_0170494702 /NCGR_PEP_ID=MMETSP0208-20121228/14789_1 /TAXON_ID=197538 /ORGANISM="Strombidium inclinatum, Strain S3" /LENGTH=97 /DNA_ID=CAMNT_0010770789 /DNA_START=1044 /DNA_END=1337 /DNA_ORIENTATION=+
MWRTFGPEVDLLRPTNNQATVFNISSVAELKEAQDKLLTVQGSCIQANFKAPIVWDFATLKAEHEKTKTGYVILDKNVSNILEQQRRKVPSILTTLG